MGNASIQKETSIFIVPRASSAWKGNEAGWITASGWAAAGRELWGEALVATRDGVFTPSQSVLFPIVGTPAPYRSIGRLRKLIPEVFITAWKDWRLWSSRPTFWPIEDPALIADKKVKMVWERHDLFCGPGSRLAKKLNVPFVISIEAPVVWESNRWGVRRPFWGRFLDRLEGKSLQRADLVCCVSDQVRNQAIRMGVAPQKAIVTPNRVDSTIFNAQVEGLEIRRYYSLTGKKVIGWTGSFRPFHGLDALLAAFKLVTEKFENVVLVLVGDGLEFQRCIEQAKRLGIRDKVVFPGRQPFTEIPKFVSTFDIALVSAASANEFHYSPLKLREYLALGRAVIAPDAGNLSELFMNEQDVLLYTPGDIDDLTKKMMRLLTDDYLADSLRRNARKLFDREGTWLHELNRIKPIIGV